MIPRNLRPGPPPTWFIALAVFAVFQPGSIKAQQFNDHDRRMLYNTCRPMAVMVESVSNDARKIGLNEERLRVAAETQLRTVGLYTNSIRAWGWDGSLLYVQVHVVGAAFDVSVEYHKGGEDRRGYQEPQRGNLAGAQSRTDTPWVAFRDRLAAHPRAATCSRASACSGTAFAPRTRCWAAPPRWRPDHRRAIMVAHPWVPGGVPAGEREGLPRLLSREKARMALSAIFNQSDLPARDQPPESPAAEPETGSRTH